MPSLSRYTVAATAVVILGAFMLTRADSLIFMAGGFGTLFGVAFGLAVGVLLGRES